MIKNQTLTPAEFKLLFHLATLDFHSWFSELGAVIAAEIPEAEVYPLRDNLLRRRLIRNRDCTFGLDGQETAGFLIQITARGRAALGNAA